MMQRRSHSRSGFALKHYGKSRLATYRNFHAIHDRPALTYDSLYTYYYSFQPNTIASIANEFTAFRRRDRLSISRAYLQCSVLSLLPQTSSTFQSLPLTCTYATSSPNRRCTPDIFNCTATRRNCSNFKILGFPTSTNFQRRYIVCSFTRIGQ